MSRTILLFILFLCFQKVQSQGVLKSPTYDSILKFREKGNNTSASLEERLKFAEKAVSLSEKANVDSIVLRSRRILSTVYLHQWDLESFKNLNYINLKLAKRLNDTLSIGIASNNLGYYHSNKMVNDSAYYYLTQAIDIFDNLKDYSRKTEPLSFLSLIQYNEKDYYGAEENAITAIKIFMELPKTESNLDITWMLYNRLASISLELRNYDDALNYHNKAIEIAKGMKNGYFNRSLSIHNQAFVFRKKGDFKKGLELYQSLLKQKKLFEIDPTLYPLIIDNIAFTRFENGDTDYDSMEKMFMEAYKRSDSFNDKITKLAVTIDLAKFYKGQSKVEKSLKYAEESYELAKETTSNDILLESMLILSELKSGDAGKKFLNEHIKLSDSLLHHERSIRNKFARVKFATDQIEQENQRIALQRFWLLIVSIVLLLTLFLLYVIITQRAKNKELKFERQQQQTNEEIYNLMLSQQDKLDEARSQEKKRISEEMHDGVLGRLFGTRLSLDSLNFSEGKEAMKKRSIYIDDLKTIEQEIRKISHDLNTDFVSGSGYMDIVETLIQNQTRAYKLTYEFYYTDDINWEGVSNKTKIHVYRILQETMQNIYKHADANFVKISFHLKNNLILLTIFDNGKGFSVNKSKIGIGLKNINSRVKEVDGTVQFDSENNQGTSIIIQIPYKK